MEPYSEIPGCSICLEHKANQKNSHIIPFRLIKTLATEETVKKSRDRELTFSMSESGVTTAYIGRKVSPEKIAESFGREIGEQVLDSNVNQFAKDNFLCSDCEKKLGNLESSISSSFLDIIDNFRTNKELTEIEFKDNAQEIRIFFYSIFFRISVVQFFGFKLDPSFEESIRRLLNSYLNNVDEKIVRDFFPIQLCVVEEKSSDTNNGVINHPTNEKPYFSILNHFVVFLFFKEKSVRGNFQPCFGLEKMIDKKIASDNSKVLIRKIKADVYQSAIDQISSIIIKENLKILRWEFREVYKKVFGKAPSIEEELNYEKFFHMEKSLGKQTIGGKAILMHRYFSSRIGQERIRQF